MEKKYLSSKLFSLLFTIVFLSNLLYSQEFKIILDEEYSDWNDIPGVIDSGDVTSNIDLKLLRVSDYNDFLFLFLEMNTELNLQSDNSITLYIDTDNNIATGLSINGIGAELEYTFGNRSGKFYYDNTSTTIGHDNIGLITLPTVTSNIFEMQINRNTIIAGKPLFPDSTISVIIKNNITNGDIIPNDSGGFAYSFQNSNPQKMVSYSIKKLDETDLRIVSYNIERDQLFESANKEAHKRIFQAIEPDIIGFQEIYDHTAQQTADLIEEFLPSAAGEQWYSSKVTTDIIVVSRFPISSSFAIDQNAAFLLDLNQKYQRDFLFVNAHTPCCSNEDGRQKEIDNFMAFIRDAKEEGGSLTLDEGTPIVIVGDMNLVGLKQQQTTLVTGDIVNTNIYGEAFLPDWDSTYFADTKPPTTHMPSTFTWYNEGSSYAPGRLDYVVYTNSIMESKNNYSLFTKALPQDSLSLYNLQSDDVTSVADHLPVIVDFSFPPTVDVKSSSVQLNYNFELYQNYPNSFNPSTVIKYSIPVMDAYYASATNVVLKVYDILGREVSTLVSKEQKQGIYEVIFNGEKLNSGIYFYKLTVGEFVQNRKMILLK
jgi:exonuclease III